MTIDNSIFYFWPHILSVDCRKSRSNLFSILNFAISCWYSSVVVNGRTLGRPLGLGGIPAASFFCLRLRRFTQHSICRFSTPRWSAISRLVCPASRIAMMTGSIAVKCVYFRLDIITPPHVVIILHKGAFCLLSVFTGSVQKMRHALIILWRGRGAFLDSAQQIPSPGGKGDRREAVVEEECGRQLGLRDMQQAFSGVGCRTLGCLFR